MHVDDFAEVVELGLDERLVAQDSGVVDQDVHAAPLVHGRRDHGGNGVDVGDVAVVRDRFAAQLDDLCHYFGCRSIGAAAAVDRTTHVIDDYASAARGEGQCVRTAESAACARDDRYLAGKIQRHWKTSLIWDTTQYYYAMAWKQSRAGRQCEWEWKSNE